MHREMQQLPDGRQAWPPARRDPDGERMDGLRRMRDPGSGELAVELPRHLAHIATATRSPHLGQHLASQPVELARRHPSGTMIAHPGTIALTCENIYQ